MIASNHVRTGLVVLATAGIVYCLGSLTPVAAQNPTDSIGSVKSFTGISSTGDIQDALEDARVQADAYYASIGADIRYEYRVSRTTGRRGGFAYVNETSVTIVTSIEGG